MLHRRRTTARVVGARSMLHRPRTTARVVGARIMFSGLSLFSQESEEGSYGRTLRHSTVSQTAS